MKCCTAPSPSRLGSYAGASGRDFLGGDRTGCPNCGSLSHSGTMTDTVAARKASTRGIVLLIVVVLAWGTMWPVNKALLAYMPPIWSIALRTCISVLALFTISLGVTGLAAPVLDAQGQDKSQ